MSNQPNQKPVPASYYDDNYYREFNRGFEQFEEEENFHPVFDFAQNFYPVDCSDKKVLDIGCGRGELLVQIVRKGGSAVGIDYSTSAINIANRFLDRYLVDGARGRAVALEMNAKSLEFPDHSFDMVYMLDIVEHLYPEELDMVYKEVARVLKKDGVLVVHTSPNKFCMLPVKKVAGWFGLSLKSSPFHINEQTMATLKLQVGKELYILDQCFCHDHDFWYNATIGRGLWIRRLARIYDFILTSRATRFLFFKTPLMNLFLSDIWIVAQKRIEVSEQ